MDASKENTRLKVLLVLLVLSILALLYILGKGAWLPRMGGPFARAYRQIKKQANLPQGATAEGVRHAVSSMHAALNTSAGHSLFAGNLDQFLAKKPAFKAIEAEIHQFFGLSNQVFFEPNAKHTLDLEPLAWLKQFCRRCRDCERGLTPDALNTMNKA